MRVKFKICFKFGLKIKKKFTMADPMRFGEESDAQPQPLCLRASAAEHLILDSTW
jgi:hypothetical protein